MVFLEIYCSKYLETIDLICIFSGKKVAIVGTINIVKHVIEVKGSANFKSTTNSMHDRDKIFRL